MQEYGCAVNTTVVIAATRDLGRIIDYTHFNESGGPATLNVPWAKSLLKRMNFTKRQVSDKTCAPSQAIEEVRRNFLSELIETVKFNESPVDLILNWDQIEILLDPNA